MTDTPVESPFRGEEGFSAWRCFSEGERVWERQKVAVYSGQTSKIMGIAVATTRISSGNPIRQ